MRLRHFFEFEFFMDCAKFRVSGRADTAIIKSLSEARNPLHY
jgi:hypothetical protein